MKAQVALVTLHKYSKFDGKNCQPSKKSSNVGYVGFLLHLSWKTTTSCPLVDA
jgi:hypothetical protein